MGPWSDIYSLSMTMRFCITGKAPIPSTERQQRDNQVLLSKSHARKYSKEVLQAIDWASELDYERRPPNVDAFLDALTGGRDTVEPESPRRWFG